MKLRLMPIMITVAASAAILFGGWFAYHSFAMENPLSRIIENTPGVEQQQTTINNGSAVFKIKITGEISLRELYHKINNEGASIIGKRKIELVIEDQSSPALDKWWSSALFDVAQAMETRQYALIPQSLQSKAADVPGLKVLTEMDETNIYVQLTDGTHHKYIILPRHPAQMGVWPNE